MGLRCHFIVHHIKILHFGRNLPVNFFKGIPVGVSADIRLNCRFIGFQQLIAQKALLPDLGKREIAQGKNSWKDRQSQHFVVMFPGQIHGKMEQSKKVHDFNPCDANGINSPQGTGEFFPDFPVMKGQNRQNAFLLRIGQQGFRRPVGDFKIRKKKRLVIVDLYGKDRMFSLGCFLRGNVLQVVEIQQSPQAGQYRIYENGKKDAKADIAEQVPGIQAEQQQCRGAKDKQYPLCFHEEITGT